MKSTFEPGPAHLASRAWTLRLTKDAHADHMTAYYAGWFLDAATAGPRTIKEGREEQQFPEEVYASAEDWYQNTDYLGGIQPGVEGVFAFEHFSRFETANRVWPPLVPATWLAFGRSGLWLEATNDPARHSEGVLTYRRDYEAPTPGHVAVAGFVYGELVPGSSGNPAARRGSVLVWEPRHCTV